MRKLIIIAIVALAAVGVGAGVRAQRYDSLQDEVEATSQTSYATASRVAGRTGVSAAQVLQGGAEWTLSQEARRDEPDFLVTARRETIKEFERFAREAKLSDDQRQKTLGLVYLLQLEEDHERWSILSQAVADTAAPPHMGRDVPAMMTALERDLATFLTPEQLRIYGRTFRLTVMNAIVAKMVDPPPG
jgi:hypothetical protein